MATLLRHPETPSPNVAVEADVDLDAGRLRLTWRLSGDLDAVVIPPADAPVRRDELWRRTCFEAFVAMPGGGYVEINIAPSLSWAAYRFDDYRSGMTDWAETIETQRREDREGLCVLCAFALGVAGPVRVALSTVLEHVDGSRSYWALRHPAGKPDFHHPDSFVLELP